MHEKIFLSYGHDRYASDVLQIKADLEERGHEVWFDLERLRAGVDWESYIEDGLRWCDKVVLAMTPHSVRRSRGDPSASDGFCLNEIAKALQLRRPILPILLTRLDDGPPTSICRLQYVDMTDCVPIAESRSRYEPRLAALLNAIEEGPADTEGNQSRLLRYLQPLNFDSEMSAHIARFVGRRWLLDSLDSWLSGQPDSRVCWVVGGPGVGKTAFATHLCHTRADVIACHFCRHGHADKTDARRAMLSLIYQLSLHLPEYARKLIDLPLEEESQKNAQTLFENLILDPLTDVQGDGTVKLVVIDALDEAAGPDQRNDIASIVARNWEQTPPWLRLVITSRPETEVVSQLQALRKLQPVFIQAEGADNLRDAQAFLEAELAGRPAAAKVIEALLERSAGNFLYLRVVLDEIEQGRINIDHLDSFPRGMGGYYQQFFERRFTSLSEYRARFRPVIAPIIAQRAPVSLSMLAEATQLDRFAVEDALQVLGSLFPVQSDIRGREPVVTTLHKSLRDWLIGHDELTGRLTAGAYAVDAGVGEARLAEVCWAEYIRGTTAMSAYAMHHLLDHLVAVQRFDDLEQVMRDESYLRARNLAVTAAGPALAVSKPPDPRQIEIRRLEQLLRSGPPTFNVLFNLGVLHGQFGDWKPAIDYLTRASDLAPKTWEVLINLSLAYAEIKQFETALTLAERALQISSRPAIFVAVGLAQEGLDRQEEAIGTYSEGMRLFPENPDLPLLLGNLVGRMGDFDKAIENYRAVLRIDPTVVLAISNIAYALEEQGKNDEALTHLRRATEVSPDDSVAWFDLGHAYKKKEMPVQALECFRSSVELDPRFYKAVLSVALALEDMGEMDESVEYYARAMSLTDSQELRDAIARQIVRGLKIREELRTCFEPAVALEYCRHWLKVNRSKSTGGREAGGSFSHYRIVEKIGEGRGGIVYRAQEVSSGRVVALKILYEAAVWDVERVEEYWNVAKAVAALQSPYICRVEEVGEVDETVFVAMEFVIGRSLRSEIDRRGFESAEIVTIATQLAEGLALAHKHGVVHGNIKPANILLADGAAKIVDFGLVPLLERHRRMSEEADIYDLGAVLYEMARDRIPVAQRMPFTGFPREMLANVPDPFAKIIVKAVGNGYSSMKDLRNDLQQLPGLGNESPCRA